MKETIKFQMEFESHFWDRSPELRIFVDDKEMFHGFADQKHFSVNFICKLDFGLHTLKIQRTNKTDDQCVTLDNGTTKDQYIILEKLTIDDINVQNLIWHRSWYEPDYPSNWKKQQIKLGNVLEEKIPGEVWLSHNGIWYFKFTSPFYKFVIDQFTET